MVIYIIIICFSRLSFLRYGEANVLVWVVRERDRGTKGERSREESVFHRDAYAPDESESVKVKKRVYLVGDEKGVMFLCRGKRKKSKGREEREREGEGEERGGREGRVDDVVKGKRVRERVCE